MTGQGHRQLLPSGSVRNTVLLDVLVFVVYSSLYIVLCAKTSLKRHLLPRLANSDTCCAQENAAE